MLRAWESHLTAKEYIRVEKGRFATAVNWFDKRTRDAEVPIPAGFKLERFIAGKNGWIATLTRIPGTNGCDTKICTIELLP
jgi:hypothetical protein